MEPSRPVTGSENDDLAIVKRLDVRSRRRGQHRERRLLSICPLAPKASDAEERLSDKREPVLGFGVFLTRELEEAGRGN